MQDIRKFLPDPYETSLTHPLLNHIKMRHLLVIRVCLEMGAYISQGQSQGHRGQGNDTGRSPRLSPERAVATITTAGQ